MDKIKLTASQIQGVAFYKDKLASIKSRHDEEMKKFQQFLVLCLEENGGDKSKPYHFNDAAMEWALKEESNA